jgi:transcription elongation factor GreA
MPDQPEVQRLSRAAYERLKAELEDLQTTGRARIAERLQRARELGDLSENAEYHETKDQQGLMEARIAKIESILRHAEVVDAPVVSDTAVPGTIVTIRSDTGEEERYLLAQSKEERGEGVYTVTEGSPLGQALSGKRVGDEVSWQGPNGTTYLAELIKLESWEG